MEFGIMFKGIDYWMVVTGYDYTPEQQQTRNQPGYDADMTVYDAIVSIDGAETQSEMDINRQLAENCQGMFDRIMLAKEDEVNEKALVKIEDERLDYEYERADYLRDCKRDEPAFW